LSSVLKISCKYTLPFLLKWFFQDDIVLVCNQASKNG